MSFDVCKICGIAENNVLELGEKMRAADITAHYFCLLLSSNLMQNGEDDEGICGFLISDIQTEIKRANLLNCCYCNKSGANIGCCHRSCRRAFHLPCAIKENCLFEFNMTFRSFCDRHHSIIVPAENQHNETDRCNICLDEMGSFHIINSVQSPCCNNDAWYHKLCLMKMAQSSGYFFRCPLCNDAKKFKQKVKMRGVFVPDRDASWEDGRYDEQEERPSNCDALVCYSHLGRHHNSKSQKAKYNLIFCKYCGSSSVHRYCNTMTIINAMDDYDCERARQSNGSTDYVCRSCKVTVFRSNTLTNINSQCEIIGSEKLNEIESILHDSAYGSHHTSLLTNTSIHDDIFKSSLIDWHNPTMRKDFSTLNEPTRGTLIEWYNQIPKENANPKNLLINDQSYLGQQSNGNAAFMQHNNVTNSKLLNSFNSFSPTARNATEQQQKSLQDLNLFIFNAAAPIKQEPNPFGIKCEYPENGTKTWELYSQHYNHTMNKYAWPEQNPTIKLEEKPAMTCLQSISNLSQLTKLTHPWYGGNRHIEALMNKTKLKRRSNNKSNKHLDHSSTIKRFNSNNYLNEYYLRKYAHFNLKLCSIVLNRIDITKCKLNGPTLIDGRINVLNKVIHKPCFQPFVLLTDIMPAKDSKDGKDDMMFQIEEELVIK